MSSRASGGKEGGKMISTPHGEYENDGRAAPKDMPRNTGQIGRGAHGALSLSAGCCATDEMGKVTTDVVFGCVPIRFDAPQAGV